MRCTIIAGFAAALVSISSVASPQSIEFIAKFTGDGVAGSDWFGGAVALDSTIALIGARESGENGMSSGAAYLIDTAIGTRAKLIPADNAEGDWFGGAVALDGANAVIGAWGDDDGGENSGSAYIFDSVSGTQTAKLIAEDGADIDLFGIGVAIKGAKVVAGSPQNSGTGAAYLFDIVNATQTAKLIGSDAEAFDYMGVSIAFDGDTILIGAYHNGENGARSGSAYLFDAVSGKQTAKLTADDGAENDEFGVGVALTDSIALIGASGDDDVGEDSGSAYIFDFVSGTQTAKLTAPDGAENDQFGRAVALTDSIAIIGAPRDDDNGSESGSAYVFNIDTRTLIAKITVPNGGAGRNFGTSVAASGDLLLVGSLGAAYLYRLVNDN